MTNTEAVLALIADLYSQVTHLTARNHELTTELASLKEVSSDDVNS